LFQFNTLELNSHTPVIVAGRRREFEQDLSRFGEQVNTPNGASTRAIAIGQ
jgi:hypothetical protein